MSEQATLQTLAGQHKLDPPPHQKKMRKVNQLYLQLVLSGPIDVLTSLSPHRNTGGKENTQESILGPKVLAGFSPFFLLLVHFL